MNDCVVSSGGRSNDEKYSLSFVRAILLGYDSKWAVTLGYAFGYGETVIRKALAEIVNGLVYPGGARIAHAKRLKTTVNDDTEIADATSGTGTPPKTDVENQTEQVIVSTNGYSIETEFALPVDPRVKLSSDYSAVESESKCLMRFGRL